MKVIILLFNFSFMAKARGFDKRYINLGGLGHIGPGKQRQVAV